MHARAPVRRGELRRYTVSELISAAVRAEYYLYAHTRLLFYLDLRLEGLKDIRNNVRRRVH